MTSKELLLDYHTRIHYSFQLLLDHCEKLSDEELNQKIDGFGYPTVRLQLHHMLGAEKYWLGVIQGRIDADDDVHLYTTLESLKGYRTQNFDNLQKYIKSASEEELTESRTMLTWGNKEKVMKPINIIFRTQTHIFHHQGQILAMCRLMGQPANGFDFKLD